MSDEGLAQARAKMTDAGVAQAAIDVFSHFYRQLEEGVTGFIAEDSIEPLTDPDLLESVEVSDAEASAALAKTVIIKLNGGLGTSMGMDKAKSLLPVRDGKSFLDIIVEQVVSARATHDAKLPLIFMNSFRTQDDTLAALAGRGVRRVDVVAPGFAVDCLETLEEVAMMLAEEFAARGGELRYIPCLNESPAHAAALAGVVRRELAGWG